MKYWFYAVVKGVLWVVFRLGFSLQVRGQSHVPRAGPCVVACNHVSLLDPPVLGVACPRRLSFLAREDLFRSWSLGAFLRGIHAIPIHRGVSDVGAIRAALAILRAGGAVAIFPEGTRQRSGVLAMPRRGVVLLAAVARVPIIPVLVKGTYQAMPAGVEGVRLAKIRVAFGPPISYTASPVSSGLRPGGGASSARVPQRAGRGRHQQLTEALYRQWRLLEAHLS